MNHVNVEKLNEPGEAIKEDSANAGGSSRFVTIGYGSSEKRRPRFPSESLDSRTGSDDLRKGSLSTGMIEAVFLVRESPHSWMAQIVGDFPATIRILDCKLLAGTEGVQQFFELDAPEEMSDKIIDTMQKSGYISEVEVIRGKGGRILGEVRTHRCTACRCVATSGCHVTSCHTRKDGTVEWVVAAGEAMFRQLLDALEKSQVHFEVISLSRLEDVNALTARQETILQIALEKGFFDFPRKIRLREFARTLEVSAATLSEILRRAEKMSLIRDLRQSPRRGRASVQSSVEQSLRVA
jgi:predicted DNA binding protein